VSARDEAALRTPSRSETQGAVRADAALPRIAAIPTWVWLACIVGVSAVAAGLLARAIQSPTVFGDELISAELARSFADSGHFLLREVATDKYGPLSRLYPILIAPSFLSHNATEAFALMKAINALLFSLAAVPTYLIARRLVSRKIALVAAALAVAVPGFVYVGMVMTESAAYPAFLLCALAMIAALERPTRLRQVAVFAAIGLAFSIRAQAVVLLPAYVSAILLLAALEIGWPSGLRTVWRYLRPYGLTWLVLLGGATVALLGEAANGGSPAGLLGSYNVVAGDLDVVSMPRWFIYQLADLDLYAGVIPFVAFCAALPMALRGTCSRELRIFGVTAVSLVIWVNLLVAAVSSSVWGLDRLHERNVFYVVPLILIGFLVYFERKEVRARRLALVAAVLAVALPATLPFASLAKGARVDSLALLPWSNTLIPTAAVPIAMAMFAAVFATAIFAPRQTLPILIGVVALNFVATGAVASSQSALAARLLADVRSNQTWIDDAVGRNAEVAAIWFPNDMACVPKSRWYTRELQVWENEFFNRSIGPVYYVGRPLDPLPERRAIVAAGTGVLRPLGDERFTARYLAVGNAVRLDAPLVSSDRQTRTTLYRIDGPTHVIPPTGCAAFQAGT
jgi:hypothetical protein